MTETPAQANERFEREALVRLPDVARFALSLARDEADADDLVQDTFVAAYKSWHLYAPGTDCRSWLFTICRRQFYRSHQGAQRLVDTDDAELESLAAAAIHTSAKQSGADTLFEQRELGDAIRQAIDALAPVYRDAVLLVDVNDRSYDEASAILGVPVGTVRSRLFRARRQLQEQLLSYARELGIAPGGASPKPKEGAE